MNKLWLIAGREYSSRVKKKSFILTTIFIPLGFVLLMVGVVFLMMSGIDTKTLAVVDEGNLLKLDSLALRDGVVRYQRPENKTLEELKSSEKYDGVLLISEKNASLDQVVNVEYHSKQELGSIALAYVENSFLRHIRNLKIKAAGLDKQTLEALDGDIALINRNEGQEDASTYKAYVGAFLGNIMMMILMLVIMLYGQMVMRSVMEEKNSRVVEVIISSVKPFQLMMGKVLGVGAVGLTQLAIWAIIFPLMYMGGALLLVGQMEKMRTLARTMGDGGGAEVTDMVEIEAIMQELGTLNYPYIIVFTLLFFLVGYILYASLFAAMGAAMEGDSGENQTLVFIVILPIMIAMYIGMVAAQDPNSTLAVGSSLFPLFSPIVMPIRIVFTPPLWQVLLSLFLALMTSLFMIWIAGRIYRVGILMFGKQASILEIMKWIFRKD